MGNWIEIEKFCDATRLKRELIEKLIKENKIKHKKENGIVFVEANTATNNALVIQEKQNTKKEVALSDTHAIAFAEKTIGTILNLHEKVLEAKDESIGVLKNENKFLKDALFSMQELYDDDQKNAQFLREQLERAQEELELMKRKYRLMWGKAGGKVELSPLVKEEANKDKE